MKKQAKTPAPKTETLMIASDLKAAGFAVSFWGDWLKVAFRNRRIEKAEIVFALEQAGYEACQYRIKNMGGAFSVIAEVA